MLLDVRSHAPQELYKPYAHVHNALEELWQAAEVVHWLPALFDADGHLPAETLGRATTRLEQAFANVAEHLTAAQELLTTALPWFAKGNASPLPKLRYRTLYGTSAVLLASTCHELAYSIVEAVIRDLSSQTSDPFLALSQSGLSRLTDKGLLKESLAKLSSRKWEWPLIDAYYKLHLHLLMQLRREFLRAWADGPFEASESNELTADLWVLQETSKANTPCARRDAYFFKQSQEGKRPAQIAKEWNADQKQQKDISPRCVGLVTLDVVRTALKRFKKKLQPSESTKKARGTPTVEQSKKTDSQESF